VPGLANSEHVPVRAVGRDDDLHQAGLYKINPDSHDCKPVVTPFTPFPRPHVHVTIRVERWRVQILGEFKDLCLTIGQRFEGTQNWSPA
jgi:hypothetical protein